MSSSGTIAHERGRKVGGPDTGGSAAARTVLCTSGNGRIKAGLAERLEGQGASVVVVATLADAMSGVEPASAAACVLDLTSTRALPAPVRLFRARYPRVPIVAIVDSADPLMASDALQAGAFEVLPWPCEDRDLALVLANIADSAPQAPGAVATDGVASDAHEPLFAHSVAMREVLEAAGAAAATRGSVLLCGEPGTGRRLLARTIHTWSNAVAPFVDVDCREEDPQKIERRLFGASREERAPTDAIRIGKDGAVFRSHEGTLYLTHVGELPARVQASLARVLRDREALVGERDELVGLNVRPIAAVDPGVDAAVADGRLRPDLFERLSQWRVDLAPLRRRREDVPALATWLLGRACARSGHGSKAFSRSALTLLAALPWHGNVQELQGLIDSLVRAVSRHVIQIDDLLEHTSLEGISAGIEAGVTLKDAKTRFERDCIAAVLKRHHGRVGEAAKALGIQRTNLYRKVRQLNVSRSLLSARR